MQTKDGEAETKVPGESTTKDATNAEGETTATAMIGDKTTESTETQTEGDNEGDTKTNDSNDDLNSIDSDSDDNDKDAESFQDCDSNDSDAETSNGEKRNAAESQEEITPEGSTNDKATNTTAPEMVSQSTQASVPITGALRKPAEGQRKSKVTICDSTYSQAQILEADFACHIEEVGTFYLIVGSDDYILYMWEEGDDSPSWWDCASYGHHARNGGCKGNITGMIPMTESLVVILYEGSTCLALKLSMKGGTITRTCYDLDVDFRPKEMVEAIFPTLNTKHRLGNLRGYGAEDFKIICEDNKELLAHSVVLASRWDAIHDILVAVPEENSFRVQYNVSWMEPVISHCYGEDPKALDLVTATGVAIVADRFELPELLVFALRRIKQESTDLSTNLKAWKIVRSRMVYGANAPHIIMGYLACRIQEQLSMLAGSKESQELLKGMSKTELIILYNDLSRNIGVEEKRRQARREHIEKERKEGMKESS